MKQQRRPRVLVMPSDDDAPGFYRLGEPYSYLWRDCPEIEFHVQRAAGVVDLEGLKRAILWCDALVSQRAMDPIQVGLFRFAKAYGKTVILDFDDALLHIPSYTPVAAGWGSKTRPNEWLRIALGLADHLHLSTPELARAYRAATRARLHVFLNGLPVGHEKYDESHRRRAELPLDRPVVMWHGTPCHTATFEFLNRILRATHDARPTTLFALCSTQQEWIGRLEIPDEQKVNIQGIPVRSFAGIPSFADIHLTPIHRRTVFTDGKSELKVLQAAVWALPAISSPTAPYQRFHDISGGANVIVGSNSIREWRDAIVALIDDPARQRALGERAQHAMQDHYDIRSINRCRRDFYFELFGLPASAPPRSSEPCAAG